MDPHTPNPHDDDRSAITESPTFCLVDVTALTEDDGTPILYRGSAPCPKCGADVVCQTYETVQEIGVYRLDETAAVRCRCGASLFAIECVDATGPNRCAYAEWRACK